MKINFELSHGDYYLGCDAVNLHGLLFNKYSFNKEIILTLCADPIMLLHSVTQIYCKEMY